MNKSNRQSYREYKDSGIEWLGEIPAHWNVPPLYARYEVDLGKMLDSKRIEGEHLLPYLRNVDVQWDCVSVEELPEMDVFPDELDRYTLRHGDLLVCEGGEVGRTATWRSELPICAFQKAVHRLRPRHDIDRPRFLFYVMRAVAGLGVFLAQRNPNTIPHLTGEQLRKYRLPFPPSDEQDAIVELLDRETANIDALVEKKERLIELLQEKRTALITHAVTKGLDSNTPMKDSGVEWLGKIPAHWGFSAIKRAAIPGWKTFTDGDWIESPYITEEGIRLIQCGNVGTGKYEEQGHRFISDKTFRLFGCTEVVPGDVLICRLQSSPRILAGRACQAPSLGVRMITSVDNCILKLRGGFDGRFVVYQMSSRPYLGYIHAISRGGTRPRISRDMLGMIGIAAPPIAVQLRIANFLDRETAKIDALIAKVGEAIERLKEYRTALISAAVTGKIDVREETA